MTYKQRSECHMIEQLNINYGADHWQLEPVRERAATAENSSPVELATEEEHSSPAEVLSSSVSGEEADQPAESPSSDLIRLDSAVENRMSNKYAPRTIAQQQQQQQHSLKLSNTFCEVCGEQYENNVQNAPITNCTICGNKTHLNCEQLTNDEYQVLCNPNRHKNIQWKCANCSWSNSRQLSSLENLVELMYNQLNELHSKIDFVCKNQQNLSSILHQYHNQSKLLISQPANCISPSQHGGQFGGGFAKHHDVYATTSSFNNNQSFNAGPRWSKDVRYLPQAPTSANLPVNHLESSTSPYYSSNLENDELTNENIKTFRNLDLSLQANGNSHFTKDPLMKSNSVGKDAAANYQHTQIASHYQANKNMDYPSSNKTMLAAAAAVAAPNKQNQPSAVYDPLSAQTSLYSPNEMLNHLGGQPQLETLLELIYDVVIAPPDVPNKEYLLCVLSHIESPSEFYVHVTDESTSNPVDDITEQLASCYQKSQYPVVLPENLNELKGKFFAGLYTSDENWYRVRVLEVYEDCKLLVQYVDYGNTETVTVDKLNYLKPELAEAAPILAVKCSLSHIKPVDKAWTGEQNFFFKSISGYDQEKIVTAYITARPEIIDYDSIIEVFLWNSDVQLDGLKIDNSKDILINSLMVEIGIANSLFEDNDWIEEAEKISKENTDMTPTEPNIKIAVASSEANRSNLPTINTLGSNLYRDLEIGNQNLSTTSNTLNPNTAAFGGNQSFESECSFDTETLDESRTYTDQILSDNMTLNDHSELVQSPVSTVNHTVLEKKGSLSPNDGKQKEKIEEFLTKPLTTFETQRKPYPLDDLVPGSTVFIKITSTRSPNFFYAVLPFGSTSYEKINVDTAKQLMDKLKTAPEFRKYKDLSNKMKLFYSKASAKDQFKSPPKSNWLVAAKEDQNFFRARVIGVNVDNTVYQLQCIDTGKVSSVTRSNIYKLKPEFYELPEFAVNYSMPNIQPFNAYNNLVNGRKPAWSEAAKVAFREFTFGNVFLANILEIVKCGSTSLNGNTTKCEKVLCDLLNIFESQENVDDYLINKNFAQYVKEEDRLRVELSTSLESDKSSLIKDDNNNNQLGDRSDDKSKEIALESGETNGQLSGGGKLDDLTDEIRPDKNAINENGQRILEAANLPNDKPTEDSEQLKGKSVDERESMNGKLESDSKQTSIETDYSNE